MATLARRECQSTCQRDILGYPTLAALADDGLTRPLERESNPWGTGGMRTVADMTATDPAPSTSCSVVVFGGKARSGIWRVWLLLILPPVLLMTLSFGYAVLVVTLARGDRSVIGPAMGPALPYIVLANHSLLCALMLWFMKLDGTSMRRIGWPLPWRLSANLARERSRGDKIDRFWPRI